MTTRFYGFKRRAGVPYSGECPLESAIMAALPAGDGDSPPIGMGRLRIRLTAVLPKARGLSVSWRTPEAIVRLLESGHVVAAPFQEEREGSDNPVDDPEWVVAVNLRRELDAARTECEELMGKLARVRNAM